MNLNCLSQEEYDKIFEFEPQKQQTRDNPKKTGRNYRRKKRVQARQRLYEIVTQDYVPHVGYVRWEYYQGRFQPKSVDTLKLGSKRAARMKKWLKQLSNQKVRRMFFSGKGNHYRKAIDYWWTIY